MKTKSDKSFLKRTSQFINEVKQETKRVIWPKRKETVITTIFVFVFSLIASIYLLSVDKIIISVLAFIRSL